MSQITLRGIDPDIEREIRRRARKSGKSITRIVLDIIKESIESQKKPPAHSLKELAGGWTEKDEQDFFESIKSTRQIDEEIWK
jgi:plasmid stability protein